MVLLVTVGCLVAVVVAFGLVLIASVFLDNW